MDTKCEASCNFCLRDNVNAIPLLPVRAAIAPPEVDIPALPGNFSVLAEAGGKVRYTSRLLTEGFLYVYDEKDGQWTDYMVTAGGHYMQLPQGAAITDSMMEKTEFACTQGITHEAKASFITVKAWAGCVTRLAWSPVRWSDTVRAFFSDSLDNRKNYMHEFDSGAWYDYVMSAQEAPPSVPNCIGMRALMDTVSEYSPKGQRSVTAFNRYTLEPLLSKSEALAKTIHSEADKVLFHGGAIFNLNDPTGAASDLAHGMQAVVDMQLERYPSYKDDVALFGNISQLEKSVREMAEDKYIKNMNVREIMARVEDEYAQPKPLPKDDEEAEAQELERIQKLKAANQVELDKASDDAWARCSRRLVLESPNGRLDLSDLAQRSKSLDEFKAKHDAVIEALKTNYVDPMAQMLSTLHQHTAFLSQFQHHFDRITPKQGPVFTRLLLRCIVGTQGHPLCSAVYDRWAKDEGVEYNVLFHGLLLNNGPLIDKVTQAAQSTDAYKNVEWDKLIEASGQYLDMLIDSKVATDLIGALMGASGVALGEVLNQQAAQINKVSRMIIGLGVSQKKALVPVEVTGRQSKFIGEIIEAIYQNMGVRLQKQEVKRLVDRLGIRGVKVAGSNRIKHYFTALDVNQGSIEQILSEGKMTLPEYTRHSESLRNQIAEKVARNKNAMMSANLGLKGLVLVLQIASLKSLVSEKEMWVANDDIKALKAFSGMLAILGGALEMGAEFGLKFLILSEGKQVILNKVGNIGKGLGVFAGLILIGIDAYNYSSTDNERLKDCYFGSAIISGMGIVALFLSGPVGIAVILVSFALAIWVNNEIDDIKGDDIENWIMRTRWGIPYDSSVIKFHNGASEQTGFRILLGLEKDPKKEKEAEDIKKALDEYNKVRWEAFWK